MKRFPLECGERFWYFTFQRPGYSIYVLTLFAHAVWRLNNSLPKLLSQRYATNATIQKISSQALDEFTFGVRRAFLLKWVIRDLC